MEQEHNPKQQVILVSAEELPLHCPTAKTPVWNYHPKVFLQADENGFAKCPYCGTLYQIEGERHIH